MTTLNRDIRSVYSTMISEVHPSSFIRKSVSYNERKRTLVISPPHSGADKVIEYELNSYDRILVIGFGKASSSMAFSLEDILFSTGIPISGIIITKYRHSVQCRYIEVIEAGHPYPDANSAKGTERIIRALQETDERTLVITCLSGGASSLYCSPAEGVSLEDLILTNKVIVNSGLEIEEINRIRKTISGVKGGKSLEFGNYKQNIILVLSDVLSDDLSSIGSGPFFPETNSGPSGFGIARNHGISDVLPDSVKKLLERKSKQSTDIRSSVPDKKKVDHFILASNRTALLTGKAKAPFLGYTPFILTGNLYGEAREMAKVYISLLKDFFARKSLFPDNPFTGKGGKICFISGGETQVTLRGSGKGGRNQEMGLAFLIEAIKSALPFEKFCFLSCSTDGTDGPTDASGALIDINSREKYQENSVDNSGIELMTRYLNRNDSYPILDKFDSLVFTGPTGTNVCDVQILLIDSE